MNKPNYLAGCGRNAFLFSRYKQQLSKHHLHQLQDLVKQKHHECWTSLFLGFLTVLGTCWYTSLPSKLSRWPCLDAILKNSPSPYRRSLIQRPGCDFQLGLQADTLTAFDTKIYSLLLGIFSRKVKDVELSNGALWTVTLMKTPLCRCYVGFEESESLLIVERQARLLNGSLKTSLEKNISSACL